jgi:hypothetical protein
MRPSHWQDTTDEPNPKIGQVEENLFFGTANTYFSGNSGVELSFFFAMIFSLKTPQR